MLAIVVRRNTFEPLMTVCSLSDQPTLEQSGDRPRRGARLWPPRRSKISRPVFERIRRRQAFGGFQHSASDSQHVVIADWSAVRSIGGRKGHHDLIVVPKPAEELPAFLVLHDFAD